MRKETFMGQEIELDLLNDRNIAEDRVKRGDITPIAYWRFLRATWINMDDEEKAQEYELLSKS